MRAEGIESQLDHPVAVRVEEGAGAEFDVQPTLQVRKRMEVVEKGTALDYG